ncbi:MAG: SIS domain-containing protein [Candidatus Nitrosotenuis sp.]
MLDLATLEKIDQCKMYEVYDKWPDIASEAYRSTNEQIELAGIDHVVFAGMGGSGAIGDIFAAILSKSKFHVSIVKGYLLPKTVDSNTLIVTTSISGNTKETLTVLDSAKKMNSKIMAFSSGGKMYDYCIKNQIPHLKILQMHSPRASFTAFLYSMLKTLNSLVPLEKNDIDESIMHLNQLKKLVSSSNLSDRNPALELAAWIKGIPMIYYPWGLQAAATRFKNSLQENGKVHVMMEDVVEACHNGIVAWERESSVQPILLEGVDDYTKTKERWQIIKEYFKEKNIEYKEIFSVKGNILSKLIGLIYLLDYASIYYAVMNKTDPSPIESIDFVKNRL